MGNASSSQTLENLLKTEVYSETQQISNANCGGSGSGSNELVVTANGDCSITLEDIEMVNEFDYLCEINSAFEAIQSTGIENALKTNNKTRLCKKD